MQQQSMQQEAILSHPALWRAGRLESAEQTVASGHALLDEHLGGGWPAQGLTELLFDTPGIGELQLLMPAMRALSQSQDRWIVWINPPHRPCAPTLRSYGIDIDKILLIHPKTPEEALWALEKAVQSGSSAMALAWIDERQLSIKHSRRLQLAAKRGECLSCLFRPRAAAAQPSMASLRLQLEGTRSGELQVDICKRRGAWPINGLTISLEHPPVTQTQTHKTIAEQLLLWRDQNTQATVELKTEPPFNSANDPVTSASTRHSQQSQRLRMLH